MVGNLDFGQDNAGHTNPGMHPPRAFSYSAGGTIHTIRLISGDTLNCGRHSGQDICLRVHPTSDEENARKTGMISSEHFRLRHDRGTVTIVDLQSTNGTKLADQSLDPSASMQLAFGDRIDVGGALELQVEVFASAESKSDIGCCLISRVNNLPNEKYLWLIDQAKLGSDADAVVRVSAERSSSFRGLDFGRDSAAGCEALLTWNDKGDLTVLARSKQVKLNSVSLDIGERKVIHSGDELGLASTVLVFD